MFGRTLMLAGVTRIIEVCFIPATEGESSEDSHSDHTIGENGVSFAGASSIKAFRHLPPFVSPPNLLRGFNDAVLH